MTPDVVVDIGNSRMKWGRVQDGSVIKTVSLPTDDPTVWTDAFTAWATRRRSLWVIASVNPAVSDELTRRLKLAQFSTEEVTSERMAKYKSQTGLTVDVEYPARVGVDRLLSALAGRRRTPTGHSTVTINVGTAMTVDFVEPDGRFVGGAILPGPRLMARSLNRHTAKLPEIDIDPVTPVVVAGRNTEDAIELGIASAILGAADQLVWDWAARFVPPPSVFVTGGDAGYFDQFAFTADCSVTRNPFLTLRGVLYAAAALS